MYQHHIDSIENLKKYFSNKDDVIALIFGGSVAKGCEHPDSDIDAMVVLSDESYNEHLKQNTTAETINGFCTYEKGYFDIKYMTKQFLIDAANKGSEPARNAFEKAQVLFSKDPEIPNIVSRIPIFQTSEKEDKMMSFYSDFWLNYYYFFKSCPIDGYMKLHVINEIIYSIYRMILQENEILFPSNRRLEETVENISKETSELVSLGRNFASSLDIKDGDIFVEYFLRITTYKMPKDVGKILSRYTSDFEQWWRVPRPNINEW